jgi:intracellular sulfur oxidation DsrE/DsrF family protein
MIKLLISILLINTFLQAETELVEPLPSIIEPRKIVLSIGSGKSEDIHHILGSANNILKFYGPEKVQMIIVAYYHGIKAVLLENINIIKRVKALQLYDVEFIACGNTMRSKEIKKEQLLEDVEIATAGLVEIIERQKDGYININP